MDKSTLLLIHDRLAAFCILVNPAITIFFLFFVVQIKDIIGAPLSFSRVGGMLRRLWQNLLCHITGSNAAMNQATDANQTTAESSDVASTEVTSSPTGQTSPSRSIIPASHLGAVPRTRYSDRLARDEEQSTANASFEMSAASLTPGRHGYRLKHGAEEDGMATTGLSADLQSYGVAAMRGTPLSKVSGSSRDNSGDVRHAVLGGIDGISLGAASMTGSSVAGVSAVSVSQMAAAGSIADESHAPTADSSSLMSAAGGGDTLSGCRGDALSRAMHLSQTGSFMTSFSVPVSDVAVAGSITDSHAAPADSSVDLARTTPEVSRVESLTRTEDGFRADSASRTINVRASSSRSGGLSMAASDVVANGSLASGSQTDLRSESESSLATDGLSRGRHHSLTNSQHSSVRPHSEKDEQDRPISSAEHQFRITNPEFILRDISASLAVSWPSDELRLHCSPTYWEDHDWQPACGMVGQLVHTWPADQLAAGVNANGFDASGSEVVLVLSFVEHNCCVAVTQDGVADLGAML